MASFHHRIKAGKKGTAKSHSAYIVREGRFSKRDDLLQSTYGNLPAWAEESPAAFWAAADAGERANGAAFREHVIALPNELTRKDNFELWARLIQDIAGDKPFQAALHASKSALSGNNNLHGHLMLSDRRPDGIDRPAERFFKRYNPKQPEAGGRRKDSGGRTPEKFRNELVDARERIADVTNQALAAAGFSARVDHRSLKAQGLKRQAERHLGPAKVRKMTEDERTAYLDARGR